MYHYCHLYLRKNVRGRGVSSNTSRFLMAFYNIYNPNVCTEDELDFEFPDRVTTSPTGYYKV